jgi:hypothetical protein
LSLFECTTVVLRFLGRKFLAWNTVPCNMKRTYKILLSPLTLSKVHLVSNIYLVQGLYQMGCIEQKTSCIPIECILTKVGIQKFWNRIILCQIHCSSSRNIHVYVLNSEQSSLRVFLYLDLSCICHLYQMTYIRWTNGVAVSRHCVAPPYQSTQWNTIQVELLRVNTQSLY